MKISLIVAYGKNYEIGLDNKLLWHIPEDLKHFKALTSGHHMLMGRKTFESIGKPLPNRVSLILSNNLQEQEGAHCFKTFEEAITFAKDANEQELFIIGGAQVYEQALALVDTLYISEVDITTKADAFFQKPDFSKWELVEEKEYVKTSSTPAWSFKQYNKKA